MTDQKDLPPRCFCIIAEAGWVSALGHVLMIHSWITKALHMIPACWPELVPVSAHSVRYARLESS